MRDVDGSFTGVDAVRPRESVADRLEWAFGDEDTEKLSFTPTEDAYVTDLPAIDYRGQRSWSLLVDCLNAMTGKEWGPR